MRVPCRNGLADRQVFSLVAIHSAFACVSFTEAILAEGIMPKRHTRAARLLPLLISFAIGFVCAVPYIGIGS